MFSRNSPALCRFAERLQRCRLHGPGKEFLERKFHGPTIAGCQTFANSNFLWLAQLCLLASVKNYSAIGWRQFNAATFPSELLCGEECRTAAGKSIAEAFAGLGEKWQ